MFVIARSRVTSNPVGVTLSEKGEANSLPRAQCFATLLKCMISLT